MVSLAFFGRVASFFKPDSTIVMIKLIIMVMRDFVCVFIRRATILRENVLRVCSTVGWLYQKGSFQIRSHSN